MFRQLQVIDEQVVLARALDDDRVRLAFRIVTAWSERTSHRGGHPTDRMFRCQGDVRAGTSNADRAQSGLMRALLIALLLCEITHADPTAKAPLSKGDQKKYNAALKKGR